MFSGALHCVHAQSCLTLCNPMDCSPPDSTVHGTFPGKDTGVSCLFLLQEVFMTQRLNPCLLHWQVGSLLLCHLGSPVLFSRSVVADSLWPHGQQHARPPCPSPTPGVHPNSRPLNRWCHLTISSSFVLFSSCLQSFSTSGSFPMSQLFTSGGQNIGVSPSASVLPMNTQDWFL